MSHYLLSVYSPSTNDAGEPPTEAEMAKIFEQVSDFNANIQEAGAWVYAGGLMPPAEATVVHVEDGELSVDDGPYPTGGIPLGGFWIIDAPDLDDAVDYAAKASAACQAMVEVRAFQEEPPQD